MDAGNASFFIHAPWILQQYLWNIQNTIFKIDLPHSIKTGKTCMKISASHNELSKWGDANLCLSKNFGYADAVTQSLVWAQTLRPFFFQVLVLLCLKALLSYMISYTVCWQSQKKSHLTLRACELRLHFEWTKVHWKCKIWFNLASLWNPEACG